MALTGNDIVNAVRQTVVEPVAAFWSDSYLMQLINDAENYIQTELKFLEKTPTFLDVTQGAQTINLPPDFNSERGVLINIPAEDATPNWMRLEVKSLEKKLQENPNFLSDDTSLQGNPQSCIIYNRKIYLDPIPQTTVAASLCLFYYPTTTPIASLDDDLNFPENFKETIYQFVLWKAWDKEPDEDVKSAKAHAQFIEELKRGRSFVKKQSLDRRNRLDIESPWPFSPSGGFTRGFNPFA